jgi:hypothetical protein
MPSVLLLARALRDPERWDVSLELVEMERLVLGSEATLRELSRPWVETEEAGEPAEEMRAAHLWAQVHQQRRWAVRIICEHCPWQLPVQTITIGRLTVVMAEAEAGQLPVMWAAEGVRVALL